MALHLRGPTQTTAYSTHKSVVLLKSGHINRECTRCIQIPYFVEVILLWDLFREKEKKLYVEMYGEKYYFKNKKYS